MPCTTCHFFGIACSAFCAAFLFLYLFLCAALSALVFFLYCTFTACPRDEQVAVLLVSGLLVLIAAAAAAAAAAVAAVAVAAVAAAVMPGDTVCERITSSRT